MANSTTGNPLFFDTTVSATLSGTTYVNAIVWTGTEASNKDIAANDDFAITDGNGAIIIEKRAAAVGDDLGIGFPTPLPVTNLTVSKLDGGVCYIYI